MSQPNLLLLHVHLQTSNIMRHGSCIDRQQKLLAEFRDFSCLFHAYPVLGMVLCLFLKKYYFFYIHQVSFLGSVVEKPTYAQETFQKACVLQRKFHS